ncbi:MAG: type II/IV secretion system protein [Sedimentisphaerales bacterium]|nr:type II/IV secretion system protein [Sedimentisphaerales bacterium]
MRDFRDYLESQGVVSAELLAGFAIERDSMEPVYYQILRKRPDLEDAVWEALSRFLEVGLVAADSVSRDSSLTRILPAGLAHEYSIVPLALRGSRLEVAMADPRQFDKCDELGLLLSRQAGGSGQLAEGGLTVVGRLARPSDIAKMIRWVYGIGADAVEGVLDSDAAEDLSALSHDVVDLSEQEELGADASIIRFVNQLLREAVRINASDIHIEPLERDLQVRYRVDGMLRVEPVPARLKHLEAAIISRIKIMAQLDIAEKRLPQDGQIRVTVMGRPIDVRVSVLPGMFGQGVALRILDRQVAFRSLDNLGMADDYLALTREAIDLPHGVILVTGPTGSGKTTTLYGALNEIRSATRKIITVEDPIEYQLEGVTQIQVKDSIGLRFGHILRHILRHDPDVIMVGEIRDQETAQIAISAAMTGHLVFSTLHTNDAPSAPVRLLEMGVEPYLVSSSLEAVLAQRLVRLLCKRCRAKASLSDRLSDQDRGVLGDATIYESKGCSYCRGSGYSGRLGIFEMFTLNDEIRQMILDRRDAGSIREAARRLGMRSLRQSGLRKVAAGLTSLSEVYRVARDDTIDMAKQLGVSG